MKNVIAYLIRKKYCMERNYAFHAVRATRMRRMNRMDEQLDRMEKKLDRVLEYLKAMECE